ncbi:MAG: hypothetical protein K1X95_03155 [Acidimicrobiia bacterium]|nr:hypothetical protein [Acidimicrobiia bacterium]
MKLKSRGLGRKELTMDFREYTVVRDGDEIMIVGTIREPVHWDFTIRMCEDDLAGVAKVALMKPTIGLLLRAAFKRNKSAHWSVDRKTQISQAKEARKELLEKQAEKAAKEAEDGDAPLSRSEARKARKAERKAEKAAAAEAAAQESEAEAAAAEASAAEVAEEVEVEAEADLETTA